MVIRKLILLWATVVFLVGCGSAVKHIQMSESLYEKTPYFFVLDEVTVSVDRQTRHLPVAVIPVLVKSYLEKELESTGHSLSESGSGARTVGVKVDITGFRDRGSFNRWIWGPFSGGDFIESNVILIDQKTGEKLGVLKVRSEYAWVGGMEDVAKIHSRKIASLLNEISTGDIHSS
ncbi:MAG: hypothetical protein Q8Q33_10275 [Chlamydiota bacterium]|nr:hypothetical protein [Chlamydiota bacterium]